jgi:sugar phosphate isomerase/epimerase
MPIANTNDGTKAAPYMRRDLNLGTLGDLPAWSKAPRGDERAVLQAVKAAGYQGVQGANRQITRELGLGFTGGGRVNLPQEAEPFAKQAKEQGVEAATLHVGWGHESDLECDRLVGAITEASVKHGVPIYVETHRATITQDTWRTVKLVERNPEVRFNADFSHWYTGLEMAYGDINARFDFLEPVFERVRFFHGRIGNPSSMQVDCGDGTDGAGKERSYVAHFREMWTRSCMGFLRSARPGDFISFNPELLPSGIHYARVFKDGSGAMREECDRWEQAAVLSRIAQEAFAEAKKRVAGKTAAAK